MGYGIFHDQITAQICVEYFTIAHPPLVQTTSPALIGLAWAAAATFWVGLALGVPLALASQSHSTQSPPVPLARLRSAIFKLLALMMTSAILCGAIGFELSRRGIITLPEGFFYAIPFEQHHWFMAVWFAHGASYLVGIAGGISLIFRIWNQRGRPAILQIFPQTVPATIRVILVVATGSLILWLRLRN